MHNFLSLVTCFVTFTLYGVKFISYFSVDMDMKFYVYFVFLTQINAYSTRAFMFSIHTSYILCQYFFFS